MASRSCPVSALFHARSFCVSTTLAFAFALDFTRSFLHLADIVARSALDTEPNAIVLEPLASSTTANFLAFGFGCAAVADDGAGCGNNVGSVTLATLVASLEVIDEDIANTSKEAATEDNETDE